MLLSLMLTAKKPEKQFVTYLNTFNPKYVVKPWPLGRIKGIPRSHNANGHEQRTTSSASRDSLIRNRRFKIHDILLTFDIGNRQQKVGAIRVRTIAFNYRRTTRSVDRIRCTRHKKVVGSRVTHNNWIFRTIRDCAIKTVHWQHDDDDE